MHATALPIDHQLKLVSDANIGNYCFRPTGHVTATLGERNGPVCAPVFDYRVRSDGSVEVNDSSGRIELWSSLRIDGNLLHVERNGEPCSFTIRKITP